MSRLILSNILRFVFLVLFQVLILNNVYLGNYATPLLYVLFIIMLPNNTSSWALLILSFLLGFSVDIFSGELGFHAFASTLTGFSRILILNISNLQPDSDEIITPSFRVLKFKTFISYTSILVVIHHFSYFFVEIFQASEVLQILLRTALSSVLAIILIIVYQLLFIPKKRS